MADEVILYISAASDLEYERDLIGRAVTEIPVTLGWRIEQTPRGDKPPDAEAISSADVHLMLLGSDIRAPIGMELLAAHRAGNQPFFFMRNDATRTPAGQAFLRETEKSESWHTFREIGQLRHQVLTLLVDHILKNATHYALRPVEYENLQSWKEKLQEDGSTSLEKTRGGAGESGVIISRERYVPSEGILIRKPKKDD